MTTTDPVVVVGGGVVGLCIAYYLAEEAGLPVELVERSTLGSGVSRGNAGWVCMSHSTPVPAPGMLRYAAGSLGRPDSPLYVRPLPDSGFLRWLWGFWRSSTPSAFRRGSAAIAELNRNTFELFDGLHEAGIETSLVRPGMVHAFQSAAEARHHLALQRELANGRYWVPEDIAAGSDAHLLDPALSPDVRAAYLVPGEGVVDPTALARALGAHLTATGVKVHENTRVTGFRSNATADEVVGVCTDRGEIPCSAVVVAAGVRSTGLLAELGVKLAMQAGKGYSFSVELDRPPRHAMYFGSHRVVASPIAGTTRIAGTMELSGNNNRLDWRRITAIALASRHYLGRWFEEPDDLVTLIRDPWVGGRPFLPDGLPVIDRLPEHRNAYAATGHGMLGITLGPATGRALATFLSTGRRPDQLEPFQFR